MSRNTEYKFVDTDTDSIVSKLISAYEAITDISVKPASPEKLFIDWVANIIIQERVLNNYTGNQNIPSRAEGENLDALGELFFATPRPSASPATTTVRFNISEAQSGAILIPKGTRVTDIANTLIWRTVEDGFVAIGDTYADLTVVCQENGSVGNGYEIGQINVLIDIYDYYTSCSNTTISGGGADEATDDEYYDILRKSMDAHSTAGAKGSYEYYAKSASTEIADVVVTNPSAGEVDIYALLDDGTIAGVELKARILEKCNADDVRPLTDLVAMKDASYSDYTINLTYYLSTDAAKTAVETQSAITNAINEFVKWQSGKIGRDINPSQLIGLLMNTGIKRVVLTSPTYTVLSDGSDETTPQVARCTSKTIINGGVEDE